MKIIVTESQYDKLLVEQVALSSALNGVKFIGGLVTLVEVITRLYNSASGKQVKEALERIQSLTKQSIAGGKIDITESEMNIIRQHAKVVLNKVANELGYNNWSELKSKKLRK
jgi:hypothetical protein